MYKVRKWVAHVEEIVHDGGTPLEQPLVKAVVGAVVENPFAGRYVDDLGELTRISDWLGRELGTRAASLLNGRGVESYGKGGIVGTDGEQEHAVSSLTTVFGDALRAAVGGGQAWISSATKVGAAGSSIDIPLAFKDEVYVRSHYDAVTLQVADAPKPNELLLVAAVATGGRPHARVGGMTVAEVRSRKQGQT